MANKKLQPKYTELKYILKEKQIWNFNFLADVISYVQTEEKWQWSQHW